MRRRPQSRTDAESASRLSSCSAASTQTRIIAASFRLCLVVRAQPPPQCGASGSAPSIADVRDLEEGGRDGAHGLGGEEKCASSSLFLKYR